MEQMHSLLKRQLRRSFGDQFRIPKEWQEFIDSVNDAYNESDMDRGMLERSLELSSMELLQANSEVRAIFQAIPDLLFRLDSEGRILNYKAGATTDLMLRPKEFLGKRIQDILLNQIDEKFVDAIQQVQESKKNISLEYSLSLHDKPAFFEARLVPLPEDQIVVIIRNITERRQAEEALRLSEQRFKTLTEVAPIGIFRTDARGKTNYVNPRWCEITQINSEDALRDGWLTSVHPDDQEWLVEGWNHALAHQTSSKAQYRFVHLDGSTTWVMGEAVPQKDEHGNLIGYIGTITDITERIQVEESLKRERNLFRVVIDNLPDAIYVKDTECRKTIANVADVRNMGKKFEAEVLGKTDFDVYPKDIAAGFNADDLFVIQSGHSVLNKEEFFFDKAGKKRWLLTFKLPMRNEQGRITGLVGIGREITEQKRAMESLTLLSHTVKSIGESISITDLKNNIIFVNEAFLRTYGYTEQELVGKSIGIVSCDPTMHDQMVLAETIKGSWQGELINRKKDGTLFPIFLSSSVVYDEKAQPIGLVGVATDITERKRDELALRETMEKFRMIFENASDGINIIEENPDESQRKLIDCNNRFAEMAGRSREELLRIGAMHSLTKKISTEYEHKDIRSIGFGVPFHGSFSWLRPDGKDNIIEYTGVQIEIQGKTFTIGIDRDVTERKQAEKALQESQALYRSFIEHLPAGVFRKDSEGRYVFVNSLFCQLKGLKMDEVVGKTPLELEAFVSKEKITRPSIMKAVQTILGDNGTTHHEMIMRTGKPMEVEEVFPQFDGTTRYFQVVKSPVFGSDGKIVGTQGVQFDITERKIVEEELQKERNLLRTVIDNLPDGIYTKDLNYRKTLTNRTDVYNMGCKSEAEVLGKDDFELFPKEMAEAFIADDRSVIQTGKPVVDKEEYVVDEKGRKHFLLTTKLPFRDEQGQIIGLIGIGHDITERRLAEEALRESDEKLRNIIEHSTNLFYSRNIDQMFTYLSPQARYILDCEPDEALVSFRDFMTDNSINKLGCELAEKAVRTGARQEAYELELMSRKGRRVWVEIQEAPVLKDGKTISIVGAATDITERRWAEMALQVSEKKYRDIVTWAPIGIYQSTQSGKLLTANKGIVELLGYEDVSELIGCDMGKEIYFEEKDRERLIARHETSGENITQNSETRWKTKDGSLIWVLMTVHDVRDKSSEILYYEGFVFDITERKHAEESLRESEERYRLLVENSTDIVTEISAEDKYLYVSPNVKSILDFEPPDLVGTDVLSRVYGKDKAAIGEILSKLGGSATYRYRDRLGDWHWFESSGRVYYTSLGEQRMVMVSRDITQRRKAEQQLEVSRKQLQHFTEHLEHVLEEERKRISRELHDELGQLLTILKFDLSWLKLEGIQTEPNIIARIDAMMESVNEALASVKRISKEIRPPQLDALGLIGAIQWDIDQVQKKTGLKGIVTVEPAEVEIKGQVSAVLYRVFREALTNILRHANAEHVFIKLSRRLGSINFTIRDDGRGITKKELKGTTSLGLVGIRERLRMIGGSFTIEGKTGSGTVLSVEVPLKKKNGDSIP
jgi:PAS domain S-box-containing protein